MVPATEKEPSVDIVPYVAHGDQTRLMQILGTLGHFGCDWWHDLAGKRAPDFVIGGEDAPYLRRWWLIPRNEECNLYLHQFCRSDDDRALHDHPWASRSLMLEGRYIEHVQEGPPRLFAEGQEIYRSATMAHRVELLRNMHGEEMPVWTLFATGPKVREWGFLCPQGWRHWRDFCGVTEDGRNDGTIGRGCEG